MPRIITTKASTINEYSIIGNSTAKYFDTTNGSTSQIAINNIIQGTGKKFTFSFWIQRRRTTTSLTVEGLFSNAVSGAENQVIIYFNQAQQLVVAFGGGTAGMAEQYITSSLFYDTFQWLNIVITYDQTRTDGNRIRVFINGIKDTPSSSVAAGGFTSIYSSSRGYMFGYYPPSGLSTTCFINKKSIYLWNSELTAAEILTLYNNGYYINPKVNSGNYVSSTNLKLLWDFGTAVWTTVFTVTDSSGNNNGTTISAGHVLSDLVLNSPSALTGTSRVLNKVTPTYLTEATNLFARFTTQPSNARKAIINETIFQLKASGIWNELDAIYFFAAADEQSSLLNWKGASFNCTKVNTPTFTADQGFNGGSTSNYLTTNYAPQTNAVKFLSTGASWGFYARTTGSGTDWDMGINVTTFFLRNNGTLTSRYYSSQSPAAVVTSGGTIRLTSALHTTNLCTLLKDGQSLGSGSAGNAVAAAGTITIMAIAGTNFSSKQFSMAYMGSSSINQLQLYQIVNYYMTAIGAAV
ncbi:MAG TPA: hypothetical protein VF868_15200 [Bacteroidia bacterium]|jgi:hypothetical protein